MKLIACSRCGSSELEHQDGFARCVYCQSRFVLEADDASRKDSTIDLNSDIERLLDKCRSDPANRRRYAGLILDIDPTNAEAIGFLR
jgi:hypothetical protein